MFVDLGVGVGTTFIGVLDFLLAWRTVCHLFDTEFPVETIRLIGYDCISAALNYSRRVLKAYGKVLKEFRDQKDDEPDLFIEKAIGACDETQWIEHDLTQEQIHFQEPPSHVFAGYILNELERMRDSQYLSDTLCCLPEGTVTILMEPGSGHASKKLMRYRKRLAASGKFNRHGPCGSEYGADFPPACDNCWNARRESLHEPDLYRCIREISSREQADKRGFDEFENKLLSWSYVWLKRGKPEAMKPVTKVDFRNNDRLSNCRLRYIGRYRNGNSEGNGKNNRRVHFTGPSIEDPEYFCDQWKTEWREYYKFCPGNGPSAGLALIRRAGFEIPRLRYGQWVELSQVEANCSDPRFVELCCKSETSLSPVSDRSGHEESFLENYSYLSRRAVDEMGYRLFGFPSMYSFQHEIIGRVLTGRSILGIAATGGGKSECYILPALLLPGVTVVISPLKSLMQDQYEARIKRRYGLNHLSTFINGDVKFKERLARLKRMELGYYKLFYMTPEQLERSYVLESLARTDRQVGIRYLALDEAHCISQWGHDFRPSYLNIVKKLRARGLSPVRIALTATASPKVREDICEELDLDLNPIEAGGDVFVESSNRPELNYIVRVCRTAEEKAEKIFEDLERLKRNNKGDKNPGAAIVFMPWTGGNPNQQAGKDGKGNARKLNPKVGMQSARVVDFAGYLERSLRSKVSIYHAKMDMDNENGSNTPRAFHSLGDLRDRYRQSEQQAFMEDERSIMVATKGFGMGIDKPNIRMVIHRTPTQSLEAYAQEAGRAGRDKEQADVILYYCPDKAEDESTYGKSYRVPSDHEIVSYFLEDKYIRREDVERMRLFLRSVKRKIGSNLYFTNDEVVDFFDNHSGVVEGREAFSHDGWPEFQPRRFYERESKEHREILDRGHLYEQKTRYVERILGVLYKIRPDISDHKRVSLLDGVSQVGAEAGDPKILNINRIYESNAYYGELLRDSGLPQERFVALFQSGDLLKLAHELSLSLNETSAMISDIKYSEGRLRNGKHWVPELLDFKFIAAPKFGPASGKVSLQEWREYAGARKRASLSEAHRRSRKERRGYLQATSEQGNSRTPVTTEDDWFSWKELPRSCGWEVTPGPALLNDALFSEYLSAFMELHDARKENDWASYHRLLTGYVGVGKDGELIGNAGSKECLRSVLLGYLETNEVVSGDSCYSCNRCVPDENFAEYSMEQRKAAVVKMSPGLSEIIDELKSSSTLIPDDAQIKALFRKVESGEEQGQRLWGYLQGWTSKLLDQEPDHITAMWLRLEMMAHAKIEMQGDEFWLYIDRLLRTADPSTAKRMLGIVDICWEFFKGSTSALRFVAQIAKRAEDYRREAKAWLRIAKNAKHKQPLDRVQLYDATVELAGLFSKQGSLDNYWKYRKCAAMAARSAASLEECQGWYRVLDVEMWNPQDLETEEASLQKLESRGVNFAALLLSWLEADFDARVETAMRWLDEGDFFLEDWPMEEKARLAMIVSADWCSTNSDLTSTALEIMGSQDAAIERGLLALVEETFLTQSALQSLFHFLCTSFERFVDLIKDAIPSHEDAIKVVLSFPSLYPPRNLQETIVVLRLFRNFDLLASEEAVSLLSKEVGRTKWDDLSLQHRALIERLLRDWTKHRTAMDQLPKLWITLCGDCVMGFASFIEVLLEDCRGDDSDLIAILNDLPLDEMLQYLDGLIQSADQDLAERLLAIVDSMQERFHDQAEGQRRIAHIARLAGNEAREAKAWMAVVNASPKDFRSDKTLLFEASAALAGLFAPGAMLEARDDFNQWARLAARSTTSYEDSHHWYRRLGVGHWDAEDVELEALFLEEMQSDVACFAALLISWLEVDPDERACLVEDWMEMQSFQLYEWPQEMLAELALNMPVAWSASKPEIISLLVEEKPKDGRSIERGLLAIKKRGRLTRETEQKILTMLLSEVPMPGEMFRRVFPSKDEASQMLQEFVVFHFPGNWKQIAGFLDLFHACERLEEDDDLAWFLSFLSEAMDRQKGNPVPGEDFDKLEASFSHWTRHRVGMDRLPDLWIKLYNHRETGLRKFLEVLLDSASENDPYVTIRFNKILRDGPITLLADLNAPIRDPRWAKASQMVKSAHRFMKTIRYSSAARLENQHIEMLRRDFDYQKDPEQADMLAALLKRLLSVTNPHWFSPLVLYVEALVCGGRLEAARELARGYHNLVFGKEKETIEEYINEIGPIQRSGPISKDYYLIAKQVIELVIKGN